MAAGQQWVLVEMVQAFYEVSASDGSGCSPVSIRVRPGSFREYRCLIQSPVREMLPLL